MVLIFAIVPHNVIGIIELAAFKKFQEFEIEFVEKVSESIAASIYAAKINAKTSDLLGNFEVYDKEKTELNMKIKGQDIEIKKLKKQIRDKESKNSILNYN